MTFLDEAIVPDFHEEFPLNYEYPEQNPNGFIIIRIQNIREGKYRMDAIGIYKFLSDPRDLDTTKNEKNCLSHLEEGGTAVSIGLPTLPYGLLHNQKELNEGEMKRKEYCEMTGLALAELAAAIRADKTRQIATTLIRLPKGLVGCNDHLNGPEIKMVGNGNRLATKGRFLPYTLSDGGASNGSFILPYAFWKIPIKSSIKVTDFFAVTNVDDPFHDALASMYNV